MQTKNQIRYTERLKGVHPDLIKIVNEINATETLPFNVNVSEGLRTKIQQMEYVRTGKSKTLNSKHLVQADGYGHAMDIHPIVDNKLGTQSDYDKLSVIVLRVATRLGIAVTWGGSWKTLVDKPHWQLKEPK